MPSHLHEALLLLFRNRPARAPELLREALHVQLPEYTEVRIDSADLTDIQPAEYRADLVVLLLRDTPVLGIVLEVQLSSDEDKRYVWPVYVANLRARIRCPVCLLVIALAQMVSLGLDAERSTLYCDLILHSLPEAARRALQAMDASKYQYQSEFAQRYFGQGKAAGVIEGRTEGRAEGRVEIILKQLATRYGAVSAAVEAHVRTAGNTELDRVAERVLTARTVEEALGIPGT
jgi:hypothetical protein